MSGCVSYDNCSWISIYKQYTICKPGNYILKNDIEGRIYIKANNVQLNMNGRKIIPFNNHNNCKKRYSHGIAVANVKNIRIFNGSVVCGHKDGILICKSFDVELSDISINNCCDIGALFINVQNLLINKVSIAKCNRALVLYKCKSVKLGCGFITNNRNTCTNLIGIEECDTIDINDYQICNNIKCIDKIISDRFSKSHALVSIFNSKNINIIDTKINSNKRINNNSRLECLGLYLSDNCNIKRCETNSNYAKSGVLIGISVAECGHVYIYDSKANENKLMINAFCDENNEDNENNDENNDENNYLYGFSIVETEGSRIESCDAHNNQSNHITRGMNIENYSNFNSDVKISNSTCNKNYGKESAIGIAAFLINNIFINKCQCDENYSEANTFKMNDLIINGISAGIWIGRSCSTTIVDSSCNNNKNINGNALGMCLDFFALPDETVVPGPSNIQINNCICSNNKSVNELGIGIITLGSIQFKKTRNIKIKLAQCSDNSHYGFSCVTTDNLVYDECKADSNLLAGFNFGGMCSNIGIKWCVAAANGIGFKITGVSKGYFEGNQALGNVSTGFDHSVTPLNSTFVGNHADKNTPNYNITGGTIDLFKLDLATGVYNNVYGNTDITKWSNIEI